MSRLRQTPVDRALSADEAAGTPPRGGAGRALETTVPAPSSAPRQSS